MTSMFFWFKIILCFFELIPVASLGLTCTGPYYPPKGFSYAYVESNISVQAAEVYEKIRIKLFEHSSLDNKPYKRWVQEAADFWSNALSVKPASGRIFMSRDCESENMTYKDLNGSGKKDKFCLGSCTTVIQCIDIEIRKEHLDGCKSCNEEGEECSKNDTEIGTGVENADIVFYVSAMNTKTCINDQPVAYAAPCDLEPVLDRPVIAIVNICPIRAKKYGNDKKAMLQTIQHEMMHALGFAKKLFLYFRDKDGKPLWPRDEDGQPLENDTGFDNQKVLKSIGREWHVRGAKPMKRKLAFLITQNVKREAQNYFDCRDLKGAELEDIPGSELGHFEARVFYDEAMKPNMDSGAVFARLSLALLEDTGWYQVNYSLAEEMNFGRNLGCDFCKKSCKFWMDKQRKEGKSVQPYCDSPDIGCRPHSFYFGWKRLFSGCPLTKLYVGFIKTLHKSGSTERLTELPRKYQHFDKISDVREDELSQWGSLDPFTDCCPVPEKNLDVAGTLGYDYYCEKEPYSTWKPKPTWKFWEPKLTRNPKPTWKPWKHPPPQDAKGDEDDLNQSSEYSSTALLVLVTTVIVIML